ncbi:hypothetical protein [Fluviicola taffensis]|uniref:hypothetical protein n=1 Tax=Fluviicola taffensis TaxID=191579 RepID=UPI0011D1AEB8|nr:hypothetical protein [Fluviicola taffensis]
MDFDLGAGVTNLSSLAGKSSIVTAKYDPTGALLWARGINLNESMLQSPKFDIDANGNGVICGSFGGTIDLDPNAGTANITATAGGQTDIFAVKWTSNGNYVWGFKVGTTAADQFSCIAVDPIGDVFLSGRVINTSIDLDPSAAVANVTGNPSSAFLAKYSSSGAFIWGKTLG